MKHALALLTSLLLAPLTTLDGAEIVTPVPGSAEWTRCNLFNDSNTAWNAVAAGAEQPLPLRSLTPPVLLPDGSEFRTWEPSQPVQPRRTFFVAQRHPQASDDNPGSEDRPWKTIGRAAKVLEPGDSVIVKEGLYREWVHPAHGGTSPQRMITYQAAPAAEVIISGAEPLVAGWIVSALSDNPAVARAWMIDLNESLFESYNPFAEGTDGGHGNQANGFLRPQPLDGERILRFRIAWATGAWRHGQCLGLQRLRESG